MWVRALRVAAGVGRYKKYGADVEPGGILVLVSLIFAAGIFYLLSPGHAC